MNIGDDSSQLHEVPGYLCISAPAIVPLYVPWATVKVPKNAFAGILGRFHNFIDVDCEDQ